MIGQDHLTTMCFAGGKMSMQPQNKNNKLKKLIGIGRNLEKL